MEIFKDRQDANIKNSKYFKEKDRQIEKGR